MSDPRSNFCYKHNKEKSGYNLVLWCNDCDEEAKNPPPAPVVYPNLSLKGYKQGELLSVVGQLDYSCRQDNWNSSLPQGYRRYYGGLLVTSSAGGSRVLFRIEDQDQVKLFESMSIDHREGDKLIKMSGYVTHGVFYDKSLEDDIEVVRITFQP